MYRPKPDNQDPDCRHFGWRRRCGSQFTLVELLVVITIIAILASLLLPTLRNAKILAMRIVCANNMRQFSIAHRSYLNDYDEWTPRLSHWSGFNVWRLTDLTSSYPGVQPPGVWRRDYWPQAMRWCPDLVPYQYNRGTDLGVGPWCKRTAADSDREVSYMVSGYTFPVLSDDMSFMLGLERNRQVNGTGGTWYKYDFINLREGVAKNTWINGASMPVANQVISLYGGNPYQPLPDMVPLMTDTYVWYNPGYLPNSWLVRTHSLGPAKSLKTPVDSQPPGKNSLWLDGSVSWDLSKAGYKTMYQAKYTGSTGLNWGAALGYMGYTYKKPGWIVMRGCGPVWFKPPLRK